MGCRHDLIAFLRLHHIRRHAPALHIQYVRGVRFHLLDIAQGSVDRPRLIQQQPDAQIHLQECKAHLHAFFQRQPHVVAGVPSVHIRVAVQTHLIPEFSAQKLVHRHAVSLARQIPQGDLNAGHAAALPGRPAELLDLVKDPIHVAGIFSQQPAFEHQGIGLAGGVPHLAKAGYALIGVDAQQRAALRRPHNVHKPQIGDLQRTRCGASRIAHMLPSRLFLPVCICRRPVGAFTLRTLLPGPLRRRRFRSSAPAPVMWRLLLFSAAYWVVYRSPPLFSSTLLPHLQTLLRFSIPAERKPLRATGIAGGSQSYPYSSGECSPAYRTIVDTGVCPLCRPTVATTPSPVTA